MVCSGATLCPTGVVTWLGYGVVRECHQDAVGACAHHGRPRRVLTDTPHAPLDKSTLRMPRHHRLTLERHATSMHRPYKKTSTGLLVLPGPRPDAPERASPLRHNGLLCTTKP